MDLENKQILLANIAELQGLLDELSNPCNGRNPLAVQTIQNLLVEKAVRLNERFYSGSDHSGTTTDSE